MVHDSALKTKITDVINSDLIFICVPTPSHKNGQDTTIVESVVEELANAKYGGKVCIKSTVKPGTTKKIRKYTFQT